MAIVKSPWDLYWTFIGFLTEPINFSVTQNTYFGVSGKIGNMPLGCIASPNQLHLTHLYTADAEVRVHSAQPQDSAAAVSDRPILPKSALPQQDPPPDPTAQPPPKPTAHQPSRFATEATQQVDINSSGDPGPNTGALDEARQKPEEEVPAAALIKGGSDTLGQEAKQADAPAQQQSSDLGLRQSRSFESGAGRVPDQPQSPGQGFVEQPQDGSGGFDSELGSGLSGVKQVWTAVHLLM